MHVLLSTLIARLEFLIQQLLVDLTRSNQSELSRLGRIIESIGESTKIIMPIVL